jgi:hypothetical protein
MDDNPFIRRHEEVAENYGRKILAWMEDQPDGTSSSLTDAQGELGLDPIQFEMGINWCRRQGYFGLFGIGYPRPSWQRLAEDRPKPPRYRGRGRRWDRPPHFDDDNDGNDDDDDDDDEFSLRIQRFRRHLEADRSELQMMARHHEIELKFLDREMKIAILALACSAISTWLIVNQFKTLSDDDRAALALMVFFAVALSMFMAGVFVLYRPHTKEKD